MKIRKRHARTIFSSLLAYLLLIPVASLAAVAGQKGEAAINPALQQVVLRQNVMVDSELVLLGDFFDGTGEKATIAVAYAPEPGRRAVFDANWLYRAANAYGLKWRPMSMRQQAVVKRLTTTIELAEIEDTILAAMIDRGVDPEMSVVLSNRSLRLFVPVSADARVIVENLGIDQRTRRFSAFISTPGSKPVRVTGRLQRMLDLPVLNRRMLKGELIRSEDIKWIKTPSVRVQNNVVLYPENLIGKTPKRGLRPGYPIRSTDVRRPILVRKGSLVAMILRTPLMTLTSQGRAIEDGSDGDVIRITNTQSNNVVQAVVSGAGTVTITPASRVAMN